MEEEIFTARDGSQVRIRLGTREDLRNIRAWFGDENLLESRLALEEATRNFDNPDSGSGQLLISELLDGPIVGRVFVDVHTRAAARTGIIQDLLSLRTGVGIGARLIRNAERYVLFRRKTIAEIGANQNQPHLRPRYERMGYTFHRFVEIEVQAEQNGTELLRYNNADVLLRNL